MEGGKKIERRSENENILKIEREKPYLE